MGTRLVWTLKLKFMDLFFCYIQFLYSMYFVSSCNQCFQSVIFIISLYLSCSFAVFNPLTRMAHTHTHTHSLRESPTRGSGGRLLAHIKP